MSGFKNTFYWVEIEGERTIAEHEDGKWWFIGNDGSETLDKKTRVIVYLHRFDKIILQPERQIKLNKKK